MPRYEITKSLIESWYYVQNCWEGSEDSAYEDSIHKIGRFDTCEGFWRYFSHLTRPDRLSSSVSLQMFREDIRALWEDPVNRNGGSFLLKFSNKARSRTTQCWEKLLLNMIGEQLPSDITGAVVSSKANGGLVYVWHRTSSDEEIKENIVRGLAKALDLPDGTKIDYYAFDDINVTKTVKNSYQYVLEGPNIRKRTIHKQVA